MFYTIHFGYVIYNSSRITFNHSKKPETTLSYSLNSIINQSNVSLKSITALFHVCITVNYHPFRSKCMINCIWNWEVDDCYHKKGLTRTELLELYHQIELNLQLFILKRQKNKQSIMNGSHLIQRNGRWEIRVKVISTELTQCYTHMKEIGRL